METVQQSQEQASQRPQLCSIAECVYVETFILPGLHAACNVLRAAYIESNAGADKIKYRIVAKPRLEGLQPDQRGKLYYEYMETLRSSILKREPRALKRPYNLRHVHRMAAKYLVDHATYAKSIGCTHPQADDWTRLCESTYLVEKWRDVMQSSGTIMSKVSADIAKSVTELETAKDLEAMVHDELYEDEDLKAIESQYDVRRLIGGDRPSIDRTPWIVGLMHASQLQVASLKHYIQSVDANNDLDYHYTILGLAMDMLSMQRVMDYLHYSGNLNKDQSEALATCFNVCKATLAEYAPLISSSKAFVDAHQKEQGVVSSSE